MSKELPPCARLVGPEPQTFEVFIDQDDLPDTLTTTVDPSERHIEIDCSPGPCQDAKTFSGLDFFELCKGKSGRTEIGVLSPRQWYEPEPEKFTVELANGRKVGESVFTNSRGEELKVGVRVGLIEKPIKNSDAMETILPSAFRWNSAFLSHPTAEPDWNGPWIIEGFKIIGFTADPALKDIADMSDLPDETRKYAVVHAIIRSTKPVRYEDAMPLICICCCGPTKSPVYAYETVRLDALGTTDIPEEPPDIPVPTTSSPDDINNGIDSSLELPMRMKF